MLDLIKSRLVLKTSYYPYDEYQACIDDLIKSGNLYVMGNFIQHSNISCLEHSISVSYTSYLICRYLRLDYYSAARGGLLHDFFLYDWHTTKTDKGLHGFTHPYTALENANKLFYLSDLEKDIIIKHMWPLTVKPPKYLESLIVSIADKYCAVKEIFGIKAKILEQISDERCKYGRRNK
ncbi:MAG: HD family phosphohydrolase [Peptococcaceae bacterium]|nr:HD family phosphohydrolase [Peptococcaceae bacterium]